MSVSDVASMLVGDLSGGVYGISISACEYITEAPKYIGMTSLT